MSKDLSPYFIPALLDLTGPTAEQHAREVKAPMEDFVNYVNTYGGGILGRRIAFRYYDHQNSPEKARSVWKQAVIDLNPAIIVVMGSGATEGIKPLAERDRIAVLTSYGTGRLLYPPGWVFTVSPDYAEAALTFFQWAHSRWDKERPMRVAFFAADAPFARSALRAIPVIEKMQNVKVVASEFYPFIPPENIEPTLSRLRATEPDYVYSIHQNSGLAILMRGAARMGMKRDTQFVTGNQAGLRTVALYAGNDAAEGLMQVSEFAPSQQVDLPGVKQMIDIYNEFDPYAAEGPMGSGWALSFATTMVLSQAVERAVKSVGWTSLTSEGVFTILDNGQFDLGGLTMPLSYTPESRHGSRFIRVFFQRSNEPVAISDWIPVTSIPMR